MSVVEVVRIEEPSEIRFEVVTRGVGGGGVGELRGCVRKSYERALDEYERREQWVSMRGGVGSESTHHVS